MHAYIYFSGLLDEYLQKYGSLIPVHSDDIAEELKGIFNEEFSQPHRSHTCTTSNTNICAFVHTHIHTSLEGTKVFSSTMCPQESHGATFNSVLPEITRDCHGERVPGEL